MNEQSEIVNPKPSVNVSAIERAGMSTLADGQKVSYDLEQGRDGRESAINIALA